MAAIVCEQLTKRFGDPVALDQVSSTSRRGSWSPRSAPTGPARPPRWSSSRNSSPTGGTVQVLGADPRRAGRAWCARIALVLQSTSLDEQLSVRELLTVFASCT
jgi:ABC-2 type transport system ATP-binding protein